MNRGPTESPLPLAGGVGGGDAANSAQTTAQRARELRRNPTEAEQRLWAHLCARQTVGVRFNRQVRIGTHIADFAARSIKLAIEVDGGQHCGSRSDPQRTRDMEAAGYRVIRYWNNDVLGNIEDVVANLTQILDQLPSPNPSRKRKGDQEA